MARLRIRDVGDIAVRFRQAAVDTVEEFTTSDGETPPPLPPPSAASDFTSCVVGGSTTINPIQNDPTKGAVTNVTVTLGGGSVARDGNEVTYTANASEGQAEVLVTIIGDGIVSDPTQSTTSTIFIDKQPEQSPAEGTLTIRVADPDAPLAKLSTPKAMPAGMGQFFYADAAGMGVNDHFHDVWYKWTFDDPGAHFTRHYDDYTFWNRVYDVDGTRYEVDGTVVYLADGITRHVTPAVWDDAYGGYRPNFGASIEYLGPSSNTSYRARAAKVFTEPGTYTVRCEARVRGKAPLVATMQVTVTDPAAWADQTIILAPSGQFSGAPAGTQVTTASAALSAINSSPSGQNKRLRIKRDHAYDWANFDPSNQLSGILVDTWGEGDPPVLTGGKMIFKAPAGRWDALTGVDWRPSGYVASNVTAGKGEGGIEKGNDNWLTISDVEVDGCSVCITTDAQNKRGLVVSNFRGTNWNKYCIFLHHGHGTSGFFGIWGPQNPDAIFANGEDDTSPPYAVDHGFVRTESQAGPLVITLAETRTLGSRTAPNQWPADIPGWSLHQPGFRIDRSNGAMQVPEAIMNRCRGVYCRALGTGLSGSGARPRRHEWDMCYLIFPNQGSRIVGPSVNGTVVSNTIAIIGDVAVSQDGAPPVIWFERGTKDGGFSGSDDPLMEQFGLEVYNSTFVDERPSAGTMTWDLSRLLGTTQGGYTYRPAAFVRIGNNIIHFSKRADPTSTGDTVDMTVRWADAYPGARIGTATPLLTQFKIAASSFVLPRPLAGSPALAGASLTNSTIGNGQGAPISVGDFFGNVRPFGNEDRGAIQVST